MKIVLPILLSTALLYTTAQAQSCNNLISQSTPNVQFQVNNDEVLDVRTHLIWKRCTVGQTWADSGCTGVADSLSWQQALSEGTAGWRLPNIKELLSIVEAACSSPAINASIFPNTPNLFFWTATPYVNNNQAWLVSFIDGNDEGRNKTAGSAARLVRNAN